MSIALGDSGSTELFANYEKEYIVARDEINQKLEDFGAGSASEQRTIAGQIERAIEEAYEIIDQMTFEVRGIPSGARSNANSKLRGYRSDIDRAKRDLRQRTEGIDRDALFGGRGGAGGAGGADAGSSQRQSLLSGQQSLERSSERLRESQRVANETEAVGASILNDLRGQREQISNSRNTLSEADGHVDRSLRTLRGMARRMAANKFITYAIIAVLVILIVFVILSKFW